MSISDQHIDDQLGYEDLLKQYRELQLRVTRFSAIEQELINTRDRLDNELDMYKRLHIFNSAALKEMRTLVNLVIDVFFNNKKAKLIKRTVYFNSRFHAFN